MSDDPGEPTLELRGRPDEGRYVLMVDGVEGGSVEVRLRRDRLIVDHTEVDERFAGRGYGSRLVRHVLDDARARGLWIIPVCPFTAGYLRSHPADRDLVDPRWAADVTP